MLSSLPYLTEVHLTFGLRRAGPFFRRDLFQMTPVDVRHLSRGLDKCSQLKILRLNDFFRNKSSEYSRQRRPFFLLGLPRATLTVTN